MSVVQASLKSSVVTLLCWLELTGGTAGTKLVNLNAMKVIGSGGGRDQAGPSTTKDKVSMVTMMGSSQSSIQSRLTSTYLWNWLVVHGVPISKIGKKPTKI